LNKSNIENKIEFLIYRKVHLKIEHYLLLKINYAWPTGT